MNIFWIVLAVFFVWLAVLSIFFWNLYDHYNKLLRGSSQKTLQGLLDNLLKDVDTSKKDIAILQKWCDKIEKEGKLHIQKIGLKRFNPFHDTGGDQSFILSLVNDENTGVIISGLYSRSGTRWYAKRVEKGKGVEHELSKEEHESLKEAKSTA